MSDTPHVGPLSAEQLAELRLVVDEERTGWDGTPVDKLGFWPSKVDALLNALAAAEARATEAAAEAGKWQAEARAHAARCAVLEKADAAPYCEGQCGICDCETAPAAPQVGFGPEDGWIADLLSGTIPVEGQPAAPAPVAPQQQEGPPAIELRADRVGFSSPEYAARIERVCADVESLKSKNPNRRD